MLSMLGFAQESREKQPIVQANIQNVVKQRLMR
jgi:hypothetical protein